MSALSTELVGCSQFESHSKQHRQCSKASGDFDWDLLAANRFCRASCQISLKKEQFKDRSAQSSCSRSLHCCCVLKMLEETEVWTWNKTVKIHFQRSNHREKLVSANSASSMFYRIQSRRLVAQHHTWQSLPYDFSILLVFSFTVPPFPEHD